MSERDLGRIEVLSEVRTGRRTVAAAAAVLAISERQAFRLLARYEADGGSGLIHKARGRISNRSYNEGIRKYAVELVKTRYADFGPTLATEVLLDKHPLRIGKETLRLWMMAEGLWLSRTQRRTFHQPRLRRESYGEMIDGSDHRWFEQRGEPCTLLVFIDDATSKLMQLRFVPSESTDSYFAALQGYLQTHGCPVAFYSDKHTVFRVNKPDAKGGQGMTQFGRALAELKIEILCANSSRAKGRVERANRTLQDRLVKELRLANISDMAAGNKFLPGFLERFNEKFALAPATAENLHRKLNVQASRLTDILCHRELRHVSQQLSLAYERKQILLERSELADKLPGQYVEVYNFADRPLEVRWKGHLLPYRVFSKDQRVSHTATIENKRLSHALTIVKAQQELKRTPAVLTNSAKGTRSAAGGSMGQTMSKNRQRRKLWKYAKSPGAAISHIPTARRRRLYTDSSNGLTNLSFLTSYDRACVRAKRFLMSPNTVTAWMDPGQVYSIAYTGYHARKSNTSTGPVGRHSPIGPHALLAHSLVPDEVFCLST